MDISVKNISNLEKELTIKIPVKQIEGKVDAELRRLSNEAALPGFRRGKVPAKLVKEKFEKDVRSEVMHELINSSISEALEQEKLVPARMPSVDVKNADLNQDLELVVKVEVLPEVKLENLDSIKLDKAVVSELTAEIEQRLDGMRKSAAKWNDVERAAKKGDKVEIDFAGCLAGTDEPFAGGEAKNFSVILGEGRLLEDFEQGIIGKKAGEKFNVELTFPADYMKADLQNKLVNFSITLHKVAEAELPELNDDLAKHFGVEAGFAELKNRVEAELKEQIEEMSTANLKQQLYTKLAESYPLELPQGLIEDEINHLIELERQRYNYVTSQDAPELPRENFSELAKKRVHIRLLINAYIKDHKLEADHDSMFKIVMQQAKRFNLPFNEVISWYSQDKQRLEQLRALAIEEKASNELLSKVTCSDKAMSLDDLRKAVAQGME